VNTLYYVPCYTNNAALADGNLKIGNPNASTTNVTIYEMQSNGWSQIASYSGGAALAAMVELITTWELMLLARH